jgi:hypothetical protein
MFASENLFEHLARGLIGFGAVALAVYIGLKPGLGFAVVSLGLGAAALVALRGCPICWTIGLVETIWNALSAGGRCGAKGGAISDPGSAFIGSKSRRDDELPATREAPAKLPNSPPSARLARACSNAQQAQLVCAME